MTSKAPESCIKHCGDTKLRWAKALTTFSYSHEIKKCRCSHQTYGTNSVHYEERTKLTSVTLQWSNVIVSFVDIGQGRKAELWQHFNKRCFRTAGEGEHNAESKVFISAEFFWKYFCKYFIWLWKE